MRSLAVIPLACLIWGGVAWAQDFYGDHLLVAGQRAGNVPLGASETELRATCGEPDRITPVPAGADCWDYDRPQLRVIVQQGKSTSLFVGTSLLRTASGLQVGSTSAQVKKALGSNGLDSPDTLNYPQLGLYFHLKNGRVEQIQMEPPAK